ncbi:hypothetical protein Bca101_010453 [Brassica carinata]
MQAERRIKGYLFRGLGGGVTDRERNVGYRRRAIAGERDAERDIVGERERMRQIGRGSLDFAVEEIGERMRMNRIRSPNPNGHFPSRADTCR